MKHIIHDFFSLASMLSVGVLEGTDLGYFSSNDLKFLLVGYIT